MGAQAKDLDIRLAGARADQGFKDTLGRGARRLAISGYVCNLYACRVPEIYAASHLRVSASSILESWLGRAQAKDLGIRLAGAHAGQGFRHTLGWGALKLGIYGYVFNL